MNSTGTGRGHWGMRAVVVGLTLAGVTSFSTAVATSASAVVKNPNALCAAHGGVEHIGDNFVECVDGQVFDL